MNVHPLQSFLNIPIKWERHETNERYFYWYFDNELFLLRLNDFPDEPLLTLIKGLEIFDIEDRPSIWRLP